MTALMSTAAFRRTGRMGGPAGGGKLVIRKMLWFSVPAVLGALVASNWQDALRYIRMKEISFGKGHPEVVPAEGRKGYPQDAAHATPDGTGEFDSARRGGPVHAGPGPSMPGEARRE
jgi:hypothetical protein